MAIDVKAIFENALLSESSRPGKPAVLALFLQSGAGAKELDLKGTTKFKINRFFSAVQREGYKLNNLEAAFRDEALQFQDADGNEIPLKQVKIAGFDGSRNSPNSLPAVFGYSATVNESEDFDARLSANTINLDINATIGQLQKMLVYTENRKNFVLVNMGKRYEVEKVVLGKNFDIHKFVTTGNADVGTMFLADGRKCPIRFEYLAGLEVFVKTPR